MTPSVGPVATYLLLVMDATGGRPISLSHLHGGGVQSATNTPCPTWMYPRSPPLPTHTPWYTLPPHRFIDRGVWCCGANGRVLLCVARESGTITVFQEILGAVLPWDECWSTNPDPTPLHIAVHCRQGRHRAYASALLAAEALRALGYVVFTEAPDTEPCGCGRPNGWCDIMASTVVPAKRQRLLCSLADDAKVALQNAMRTVAIKLSIVR